MASGVLVGAMLGLVARMKFERFSWPVLWVEPLLR